MERVISLTALGLTRHRTWLNFFLTP